MYLNFNEEKKLWRQGFESVVGLDEAGRGPLAGPVVAAAVMIVNPKSKFQMSNQIQNLNVRDSKKLSEKQREALYQTLTNHKDITWGVGIISEKIIDSINILEATKLAMQHAVKNLNADFLLLDGNFILAMDISQKAIVRGDSKVFSIAAASIIAKVTRDRIMRKMHEKYPEYGFAKHKGYGTALHMQQLKTFGPTEIHRKTFWPVSSLAKN